MRNKKNKLWPLTITKLTLQRRKKRVIILVKSFVSTIIRRAIILVPALNFQKTSVGFGNIRANN